MTEKWLTFPEERSFARRAYLEAADEMKEKFLENRGFKTPGIPVPKGKFFNHSVLVVLKEYRGQKIGYNLAKFSLEIARNAGFECSFVDTTGAVSERIMSSPEFGGHTEYFVEHSSWEFEGTKPFAKLVQDGHLRHSLIVFDLVE